jgi:hypothetical protein
MAPPGACDVPFDDLLRRRHSVPPDLEAMGDGAGYDGAAGSGPGRRMDRRVQPGDRVPGQGAVAARGRGQSRFHGGAVLRRGAARSVGAGPQPGHGFPLVRPPAESGVRQREPRFDVRDSGSDDRGLAGHPGGGDRAGPGASLQLRGHLRGGYRPLRPVEGGGVRRRRAARGGDVRGVGGDGWRRRLAAVRDREFRPRRAPRRRRGAVSRIAGARPTGDSRSRLPAQRELLAWGSLRRRRSGCLRVRARNPLP